MKRDLNKKEIRKQNLKKFDEIVSYLGNNGIRFEAFDNNYCINVNSVENLTQSYFVSTGTAIFLSKNSGRTILKNCDLSTFLDKANIPTPPKPAKKRKMDLLTDNSDDIHTKYIVALYKEFCPSLPKVTKISESRKRAIRSLSKKYKDTEIMIVFQKAEKSDFLREGAKGYGHDNWRANFDWLIKESNFVKVLDGNYDNRDNKENNKNTIKNDKQTNLIARNRIPHLCTYTKPENVEFLRIYAYENALSLRELSIKIIVDFANHFTLPSKAKEKEFLEVMEKKEIYTYRSGKRGAKDAKGCNKFEFKINSITYKFLSAYAYYYEITRRQAMMIMIDEFKKKHSTKREVSRQQDTEIKTITMGEMFKQTFGFNPDISFKICGVMDCTGMSCNACKYKGMSAEDFWNMPYEKCV